MQAPTAGLTRTEIGERKISLEIARSRKNAERKAAIVAERKETKAAAKTDNEATATEGEVWRQGRSPRKKRRPRWVKG
jgi:hypothetical protein